MKKQTTKLSLKTHTIRILHDSQLQEIAGGAPTANCSQVATACSSRDRCPITASCHISMHCP